MNILHLSVTLLLYGCGIILLLVTPMIPLEPSGDFMIQKNESITLQSTQRK